MTMPNHPKRGSLLRGALTQNPVLVYAAGLTPVIIGTTYLRPAVWVTAVCVLHLFFCEALASSVLKRLPVWLRVAAYYALGLAIACPAAYLLTKSTWLPTLDDPALATVRFVMPLMATSGLAVVRCERYAVHNSVGDALHDAAESGLGFALVALVTGAVRELMGHGSLWGYEVSGQLRIRGFFMPFGGLLLLGAMAAALKLLLRHLSARGIARGADEKMEMEPEDRMERLEKAREMIAPAPAHSEGEKEEALAPNAQNIAGALPGTPGKEASPQATDDIEMLLAEFRGDWGGTK